MDATGTPARSTEELGQEVEELRARNRELVETIDAIRRGEVDAIVVEEGDRTRVYSLEGADRPYRVLVESIQEGALTLSTTGTILYANAAFAAMRGVPLSAVLGTDLRDHLAPRDRARFDALLESSVAGPRRGEMRLCSSPAAFSVQVSLTPVPEADRTTIGVVVTDRRQDYRRLSLLARMLDSVVDAVTAVDPAGTVIYWNGAAERLYGWTAAEMVGRPLDAALEFGVTAEEARRSFEALLGGQTWSGEHLARHRDGHRFTVQATRAPVYDEDGALVAVIGTSRDITAQKRAEEALQEDERRHAFLLALGDRLGELADVPELVATASGMVGRELGAGGVVFCEVDANEEIATVCADWTDGTVPSAAGRYRMDDFGIGDLYRHGLVRRTGDVTVGHEKDETAAHRALAVRSSLGVPFRRGGRLAAVLAVHSAAPRAWTDAEVELVRQAGDRIWTAVQRARAEAALRESEARYRSVIENSRDVVYRLNLQTGGYEYISPSCEAVMGYTADEVLALDHEATLAMIHPDDRPALREAMARSEREGEAEAEYRQRTRSGAWIWISNRMYVARDEAGRPIHRTGSLRDVTARKEAELALARSAENLQRSNEELQRFAYVASHDLQEPLRSIVSFSQLLERRYRGRLDSDADEFIAFIVEGGNRMQALIQDLLQVSRIETKAKPLAPTDPAAVVGDVLRSLDATLREAGATVTVGDLPAVMADAAQLEQVFTNLVGNAVKYRRDGVPPAIAISAERAGRLVEFSVRDNGIGIEPEYFDRIFEMFRRLHTHEQYGGTGIGLAVVKRIVERHGGRIRVESVPGEGSTFLFTLPAV